MKTKIKFPKCPKCKEDWLFVEDDYEEGYRVYCFSCGHYPGATYLDSNGAYEEAERGYENKPL